MYTLMSGDNIIFSLSGIFGGGWVGIPVSKNEFMIFIKMIYLQKINL